MPLNSRLTAATPLLYLTYQLFNRLAKYQMPVDPLSATFAALADPTRRAILARLALGETSVTELAEPFDMSLPAVSKHLKVLERAGLIARGREAQWRPCRLEPDALQAASTTGWRTTAGSGSERLDRLEAYLQELQAKGDKQRKRHGEETWPQEVASTSSRTRGDRRHARIRRAARAGVRGVDRPKHLSQWWGPDGFTTTTSAFDMRPGGVWRFVMHGPDGRDYENRITFDEIVKPERIVYRHGGGDDVEPVQFRTTVTFEDLGGKTTADHARACSRRPPSATALSRSTAPTRAWCRRCRGSPITSPSSTAD